MKIKIAIVLLLTVNFCFLQVIVNAQDSIQIHKITFEEAWTITNNNSHVVKQTDYLRQEKEEMLKSVKGLYFPKIGITASFMDMSKDLTLDLTPVKNAITPLYSTLANYGNFSSVPNPDPNTNKILPVLPENLSTAGVRGKLNDGLNEIQNANWNQMLQKKQFGVLATTFQWPIFVGGKIGIANNVAKIERNEVDEITLQKQGELLSELVERYFGLCLAKQAVCVRLEVYNGMAKHLQDAEKMEKEGLVASADVLHAHVFFSQSLRELTKAKRMVDIINKSLTSTLVTFDGENIEPVSELFYLDTVPSLQYFSEAALTKNPLLLQVSSKMLLSMQKIKAERAEYYPEIALQGMYTIADMYLSPYTPKWVAGVGLKWTLFDGTARSRKVSAALLKAKEVDEIQMKAQSDITTVVAKLYNELKMYKEQLDELDVAVHYAEEYVRVRDKAFQEEMSNATEVVDANLALAQVRIERLQAMYNFDLTLAKLLQMSGLPDEFRNYRLGANMKQESYNIPVK